MLPQNELITFVLGIGTLLFLLVNRRFLQRVPFPGLLRAGFYTSLAAWGLTVAEALFWPDVLNVLEHMCYAVGSVFVALWFRQALRAWEDTS